MKIQAYKWVELLLKEFLFSSAIKEPQSPFFTTTTDWESALQMLILHQLVPVSVAVLSRHTETKKIPIYNQLKGIKSDQARNCLFRLSEMNKIIHSFAAEGIPLTPYKGMAFAQNFYGNIASRISYDSDLAISEKDIDRSIVLMKKLGYQLEKEKEKKGLNRFIKLSNSRSHYIDYSWVLIKNKNLRSNIEFHWQPVHPVLQLPLSFDKLPKNIFTTINIVKQKINTFNKPYLALFTLIHHGLIDTWGKYRHLLDLAMLLKTFTKEEQTTFHQLINQYHLNKTYSIGLYILHQIFDYPHIDPIYMPPPKSKLGEQLIKAIRNNQLAGNWSDNPQKLYFNIRMRDRFQEQLQVIGSLVSFKLRYG